jgi:hypothetical protein
VKDVGDECATGPQHHSAVQEPTVRKTLTVATSSIYKFGRVSLLGQARSPGQLRTREKTGWHRPLRSATGVSRFGTAKAVPWSLEMGEARRADLPQPRPEKL